MAKRIFTLTPNPALDLSGKVASLIPNEKNYVRDERRDPGGNGINAARVAHRLGASVLAMGWLGGGTGDEILALLKKERLDARFTRIREDTRISVTVTNESTHQQTRLTFPGPRVSAAECRALFSAISKLRAPGIFILGGSIPPGAPADFQLRAIREALGRGLGVIADLPARHFPSLLTLRAPRERLLMIKPNQAELEEWAGRKLSTDMELIEAARGLTRVSALVCVSLAERGALLVTESRAWMGHAPQVQARGTVGAGDSMVGAMAASFARGKVFRPEDIEGADADLREALCWGLAAGAATAEAVGTELARASEIRKLRPQASVDER